MKFEIGDIVYWEEKLPNRLIRWHGIVLEVTKRHLKNGCNTDYTGLHVFRGYWYGGNASPLKIKNYGKIEHIHDAMKLLCKYRDLRRINLKDYLNSL